MRGGKGMWTLIARIGEMEVKDEVQERICIVSGAGWKDLARVHHEI